MTILHCTTVKHIIILLLRTQLKTTLRQLLNLTINNLFQNYWHRLESILRFWLFPKNGVHSNGHSSCVYCSDCANSLPAHTPLLYAPLPHNSSASVVQDVIWAVSSCQRENIAIWSALLCWQIIKWNKKVHVVEREKCHLREMNNCDRV